MVMAGVVAFWRILNKKISWKNSLENARKDPQIKDPKSYLSFQA